MVWPKKQKTKNKYNRVQDLRQSSFRQAIFGVIFLLKASVLIIGFSNGSAVNKLPAVQEMWETWVGLILRSGQSPGGGHVNPLQYSCLENPMDRGAWQATVHRITRSQTQLSMHTIIPIKECIPVSPRGFKIFSFKGCSFISSL